MDTPRHSPRTPSRRLSAGSDRRLRSLPVAMLALALALPTALPADPAEGLVALRTIRATALIGPDDIALSATPVTGGLRDATAVIGQEARVIIHAGRPIRPGDIGPPALVERNATVELVFRHGGLVIRAEGRALGRAGAGDTVRVMNLASRNTVTGRVLADGTVLVPPGPDRLPPS